MEKIFYDVKAKTILDANGNRLDSERFLPFAALGEEKPVNLKLVIDSSFTPYEIPVGTAFQIIVNDNYNQHAPFIPLEDDLWDTVTGFNEYIYAIELSEPDFVALNGVVATQGTVGALAEGEWGWDSNYLYVRLAGDVDPATQDRGYISYKILNDEAQNPFIEVDNDTINAADSWYDTDTETYRNPVLADGEISFVINANTYDFYERLAGESRQTTTTMQIQFLEPVTANFIEMLEFAFICRNRYTGGDTFLKLTAINFYTKAEVDAIVAVLSAPSTYLMEFDSTDLVLDILTVPHALNQQLCAVVVKDNNNKNVHRDSDYITYTNANSLTIDFSDFATTGGSAITGTWQVGVIQAGSAGRDGDNAPQPQIQYSANGTDWSATYTSGDVYIRFSVDDGVTWGSAIQVLSTPREHHVFTNADLASGVLTITGTTTVSAVVDNDGYVIVPDGISYGAVNTEIDLSSFGTLTGDWAARFAEGGITGQVNPLTKQYSMIRGGVGGAQVETDIGYLPSDVIEDTGNLTATHFVKGVLKGNKATAHTTTIQTQANGEYGADAVMLLFNKGAGDWTITGAVGVDVNGIDAGEFVLAQFEAATLMKDANDVWLSTGSVA